MKKLLITFNLLFITTIITAQCLSGDCKNGFGKIQYQDGVYEGTFKNGNLDGIGIMQYTNGNYYFGQLINSKFTGLGYFQWKDGQNHFGKWENALQNGEGIFNDAKANPTAGTWEKGVHKSNQNTDVQTNNPPNSIGNCINGYGRITYTDGSLIQAIFENGKAKLGRIMKANQYTYDGQIKNNLPNGYGQMGYTNGDHYFGFFKDGKKHGEGIFTPKSKLRYYGFWENDVYIGQKPNKGFCNELIALSKLTKKERDELKVLNTLNNSEHILEAKFDNKFNMSYFSNEDKSDVIVVKFDTNLGDVSREYLKMIKEKIDHCSELKHVIGGYLEEKYSIGNVFINLRDTQLFVQISIIYPFEDLTCISGDCQNGFGKKEYSNGDAYEGNFVNGIKNGIGSYTWASGNNYEGDWKSGERTGKGILTWANGDKYEGDFMDNKQNGKGTIIWITGNKYEGDFLNNKLTGYGKYYNVEGLSYEGNFLDDLYHGTGTSYLKDGGKFIANFKEGKLQGFGQFFMADGKLAYEGQYEDGVAKGHGTVFYSNGSKYIGNFSDNKPNGLGKMVDKDGKLINEGQFKDGEYVGQ